MPFTAWYPVLGALFITMALVGTTVKRLPFSPAMLYLGVGAMLGPGVTGLLELDPEDDAMLLMRLSEIAVLVSLFTTGLKLRVPLRNRLWRAPIRLAFLSMTLTVGAIALVGVTMLDLSLGVAVMLGAVLAPTDPVLASDVQVVDPHDTETVRFGLTGEAGLNDGTALPFLMLGLGLFGVHDLGAGAWRWFAVDILWAIGAGLGLGLLCGAAVARLVLYLRRRRREALGPDEFLALGLITLSYGLAHLIHGYGFLAVFAAGLALGRTERHGGKATSGAVKAAAHATEGQSGERSKAAETEPMTEAVLAFNEQFERIAEVGVVLCIGAMLPQVSWPDRTVWFLLVLLLAIRPLAVWLGLLGAGLSGLQVAVMSWFGVRGVGSLYYLGFLLVFGASGSEVRMIVDLTLIVIATSIVLHGISVTPLMRHYQKAPECSDAPNSPAAA